ncbi:unnamed protein product [Rhizoctonia solani]|uniref:Uncharacterized protein n=1 Tax=Rhizoctonia solani TaxID=456999 RepID=A0A8H3H4P7_9AGAM|nr:unnamed protein product [Rhizoctonia solani]
MPMLTAPHLGLEWYPNSVSHGLRSLAASGRTILPPDLYEALVDAAGRVYLHEARVNELQSRVPIGFPLHSDPYFIYSGYKDALSDLMNLIADPVNQWDDLRLKTCTGLSLLLHNMLVTLRARSMDNYRFYSSPEFINLIARFGVPACWA